MKKTLGILAIAAIFTATISFNTKSNDTSSAINLGLNNAEAGCSEWAWPMKCNAFDRCSSFGSGGGCDVRDIRVE